MKEIPSGAVFLLIVAGVIAWSEISGMKEGKQKRIARFMAIIMTGLTAFITFMWFLVNF